MNDMTFGKAVHFLVWKNSQVNVIRQSSRLYEENFAKVVEISFSMVVEILREKLYLSPGFRQVKHDAEDIMP